MALDAHGEVAATFNNSKCIVGVAPEAKIGGNRSCDIKQSARNVYPRVTPQ